MVAAADEAVFGEMEGHAEENGAVDHGADEGELDAEVQKNLQTLFELVFTYMQIYANTFEMKIEWPVAWANFVEKLYLPFSLELSLFVPTVPGIGEGKLYSRIFLVGITLPFLWYIAQYFWDEPLRWKLLYITQWEETKERSKIVAGGYTVLVLIFVAILSSAELPAAVTGILMLLCVFLIVGLLAHISHVLLVLLARFGYASSPDKLQFFLGMRLRLRKFALFMFMIVYFPIAKELLQHIINHKNVPMAASCISTVLFILYVLVAPILIFKAMRLEHTEMLRTEHEAGPAPNRWENAAHEGDGAESQIENPMVTKARIRESIVQRKKAKKEKENAITASTPDYFVLRLRLREAVSMLRELKKRSKKSKGAKTGSESAAAAAIENNEAKRIGRLEDRVKLLRQEVAECYSREEKLHARLPGNGLPLASLWQPYEPDYYWWKFATAILEKLLLVLIVSVTEGGEAGVIGCMVLMCLMFGASLMFAPFIHDDEDRLDVTTRVANISNVLIALMLLHKWGGQAGSAVANVVLFSVNIVTLIYAIKVLNPIDLYHAAQEAWAEIKKQREVEAVKRAKLKLKASAKLFQAAKEGNIGVVEDIFQDDADVDWQNFETADPTTTESVRGREMSATGEDSKTAPDGKEAHEAEMTIVREEIGWTACHACAHEGGDAHVTILKILVRRLADLGVRGGNRAGDESMAGGAAKILLQEQDSNKIILDEDGSTRNLALVDMTADTTANTSSQGMGRMALHEAWAAGSFQAVTVLMDAGADNNAICSGPNGRLLTPKECLPQPMPIKLCAPVYRANAKPSADSTGDTVYEVSPDEVGSHWWLKNEFMKDEEVLENQVSIQTEMHNKDQEQMVERMVQHNRIADLRAAGAHGLKVTSAMVTAMQNLHGERMLPDLIASATDLNINNSDASDASTRALIQALEGNRSITALRFSSGVDFNAGNTALFLRALPNINPSQLIRFAPPSGINKAAAINRLVASLEPHRPYIQHLDFMVLPSECKNMALVPLLESMRHFVALKSLNLSYVNVGGDSLAALSQNLPVSLEALYLESCDKVQEDGWLALADGLRHCRSFRELDLGSVTKEGYDRGDILKKLTATKAKLQKVTGKGSKEAEDLKAKVVELEVRLKASLKLTSKAVSRILSQIPGSIAYLKMDNSNGLDDKVCHHLASPPSCTTTTISRTALSLYCPSFLSSFRP
jgi:hypothetical protein